MSDYRALSVAVRGGELRGGQWNADAASTVPILAVHGITASHLAWPLVAERLESTRVVAPDLRGRGRSNHLDGPFGIRDHADDLARLLDALDIEKVVVLGHSMGGFVAVRLAEAYPERVLGVALIDGGLPLPTREDVPAAELPARLLGPAGERLSRVFISRDSYRELWMRHPAFIGQWSDAVQNYVDYDLDEVPGGFRPSSNYDAIATNIIQLTGAEGYWQALSAIETPVSFLRSPRGLMDEVPPLYPPALIDAALGYRPSLAVAEAVGVNHYTIVMSSFGADQTAAAARAMLAAVGVVSG